MQKIQSTCDLYMKKYNEATTESEKSQIMYEIALELENLQLEVAIQKEKANLELARKFKARSEKKGKKRKQITTNLIYLLTQEFSMNLSTFMHSL